MRDAEQEDAFVRAFVVREKRERYLMLLKNPKRRREFLDMLNHSLDNIPSLATDIPGRLDNPDGIVKLLNSRGIHDDHLTYVISDVKDLDRKTLPMRIAVVEALDSDFGSIVCCLPGKLAYYRPEAPASGVLLEKPGKPG